ncbi:MAG: hypothetical protein RR842_12145, partial [Gordonibacter sp.]|uniref:hypothetical protein n=1 Tax=Gordonibacter sp. TaxID=1968902 RepID=UPI002FC62812
TLLGYWVEETLGNQKQHNGIGIKVNRAARIGSRAPVVEGVTGWIRSATRAPDKPGGSLTFLQKKQNHKESMSTAKRRPKTDVSL